MGGYVFNPRFGRVATLEVFKSIVWKKRVLKTLIGVPPPMLGKCHKNNIEITLTQLSTNA